MIIGLEVHVSLPTKTKLFCSCSTATSEPNSSVCPICMGFPGAKPMLNSEALRIAVSIAEALHCKVSERVSFVRKVYFYPDLPKSFQITQLYEPVGKDGSVECYDGSIVRIRRIQLEEDPARIIKAEDYSLLDFNRSGMPLVEIVTEPDIKSEEGLRAFITELMSILYYLGVDIEGEIKTDLNISMAGERVEVKNITGIKNMIDAARYEVRRQSKIIEGGGSVTSETRSYVEAKKETISTREKETDEEYGFIAEPDLTWYDTKGIRRIEPVYADKIAEGYAREYGIDKKVVLDLIMYDRDALRLIERTKGTFGMKTIINGIEIVKKYGDIGSEQAFKRLLDFLQNGGYVDAAAFEKIKKGEKVEGNVTDMKKIMDEARLLLNDKVKEDYKKNPKAINFVIGKIAAKYKMNPRDVAEIVKRIIDG
ncbi:MAG: Asp-tRNA(Asn)/Glu-tRNA(Gln) amidotransferase subunit GatB [Candidatus Micrarchaeia archaeon]